MTTLIRKLGAGLAGASAIALLAGTAQANEAAQKFGAMPAIHSISLSPDGTKVAFVSPTFDGATVLYAIDLTDARGAEKPTLVTSASGEPESLQYCGWVSNARLACKIGGIVEQSTRLVGFSSVFAIDSDGSDSQLLSKRRAANSVGFNTAGGSIIDWLPGQDDKLMMARYHLAEATAGTRVARSDRGLAAEIIDVNTGRGKFVERPADEAVEYITDGNGKVRIKGLRVRRGANELDSGRIRYYYEANGDWKPLSVLDYANRAGFNPYAVDGATNRVFGFQPVDGRQALVALPLDDSNEGEVIKAHDTVDVDGLIRIGRQNRVVGVSYVEEKRVGEYFDPELDRLSTQLASALGEDYAIAFAGASADESKLLIWAGSDVDPGHYFLFDKATKQLRPLLGVRPQVEGIPLAKVRPISYTSGDGTKVPGYLTLPPGSDGKNIPAIVMPHGGPESRDEWGFDWWAQFYANQGYAVLQPNFRGSAGYGDRWYVSNGFKSWNIAIADIAAAGKWLVAEGIARPSALSIVGWSYGGYVALQSAASYPDLFKAVVAVAPVTDRSKLKRDNNYTYGSAVEDDYIGSGPHISQGSPAQNAKSIQAPVMLFHGTFDQNVEVSQSTFMKDKLEDARKQLTYVEYEGLNHSLPQTQARVDMLTRTAAFLPK